MNNKDNIYTLDGKVPLTKALPFGFQHILTMFVANITPIMIIAGICDFSPQMKATLIQNAMLIAGIGTLIQLFPIFGIGSRLPVVMGLSFTFLSVCALICDISGFGKKYLWGELCSIGIFDFCIFKYRASKGYGF